MVAKKEKLKDLADDDLLQESHRSKLTITELMFPRNTVMDLVGSEQKVLFSD